MGTGRFLRRLERIVQPSGIAFVIGDPTVVVRVVLATTFLAALSTVSLMPVFFAFGEPVSGWFAVASFFIYLGSFVVFAATGSIRLTNQAGIWLGMVSVLAIHFNLGGYAWSGGFVFWGVANCVVAAVWLDRLNTYLIIAAYSISATVLVVFDSTIQSLRSQPDPVIARFVVIDIFIVTLLLTAPVILVLLGRITVEQARSRSLLLNVLPESIADRLQLSQGQIADRHDESTVLFGDLVGFTAHSVQVTPEQLLAELDTVFSRFDELVEEHEGEKIKTIGDGYMVAFGVPQPQERHALAACHLALDMISAMPGINETIEADFQIRIGISSGTTIAGVIGTKKFAYDLWGKNVNLASRLEGAARPDQILVSEALVTAADEEFVFEPIGTLELKGIPHTTAYALIGSRT